jgi:hypothetical protein
LINPSIKRLEQEKLPMVKLEVINPSIKSLEQGKLLMVKLEVISTPMTPAGAVIVFST